MYKNWWMPKVQNMSRLLEVSPHYSFLHRIPVAWPVEISSYMFLWQYIETQANNLCVCISRHLSLFPTWEQFDFVSCEDCAILHHNKIYNLLIKYQRANLSYHLIRVGWVRCGFTADASIRILHLFIMFYKWLVFQLTWGSKT